ncbi:thermonuclease family protein [Clostridium sp.]|uniref:thermonuclease family protein n=1 Tax=Clostridium sp. TaxID=1506 RepID=UPI002FC6A361
MNTKLKSLLISVLVMALCYLGFEFGDDLPEFRVDGTLGIGNILNTKEAAYDEAVVHSVVDGDTLKIFLDGDLITVRLLLIDTPEIKHPDKQPQLYGKEASEYASNIFHEGDKIYLEYDGDRIDKYNRTLAYAWYEAEEGYRLYNEDVVKEGLAMVAFTFKGAKYLQELNSASNMAKENKLNIWSFKGYVTSKGFDDEKYPASNSDVFIAASGSSSLYHLEADSHKMKNSISMTLKEALHKEYSPCSKCFKKKG